jgi:hypothetical protein
MNTAVMEIFPITIGENAQTSSLLYFIHFKIGVSGHIEQLTSLREWMDIMNAFEKVLES